MEKRPGEAFQRRAEDVCETNNVEPLHSNVSRTRPADVGMVFRPKRARYSSLHVKSDKHRSRVHSTDFLLSKSIKKFSLDLFARASVREFVCRPVGTNACDWPDLKIFITSWQVDSRSLRSWTVLFFPGIAVRGLALRLKAKKNCPPTCFCCVLL